MAAILDGKACAEDIYKSLEERIAKLKEQGITPGLGIISFGEESGQVYVKNKIKACERLGIRCDHAVIPNDGMATWETENIIWEFNKCKDIDGYIVQLPIPDEFGIDADELLELIKPEKDVDGLTVPNVGMLWSGSEPYHYPCTPKGIMTLLKHYDIPLEGKKVTIIGRSDLVGKPLAAMMLKENVTVMLCHSYSDLHRSIGYDTDILISAVGNPNLELENYVCDWTTIIDVGINRVDGKIVGDISELAKYEFAKAYTPVPGGVGPMTVAMLMDNVVKAAERRCILNHAYKGYIVI